MDYVIKRQPTKSGQAEIPIRKFHLHIGKSGKRWLVADQEAAAENVYVEGGPNSDGFGGATLTFPLASGGELKLKGPWHSNADSLYADTGIDVRATHFTFVVVSKEMAYDYCLTTMVDVLHQDPKPILGLFHRGDILARDIARNLGHKVALHVESSGGSHTGWVKPDEKFYWE